MLFQLLYQFNPSFFIFLALYLFGQQKNCYYNKGIKLRYQNSMHAFFSKFKKPTEGILVNKTNFPVYYLVHSEVLVTGSIESSSQYGVKLQVSSVPSAAVLTNSKQEIKQSFERIKGGSICPAQSQTQQGLKNIKKDGSSYISVYLQNNNKISFLSKNVVIKSNLDVRLKIRFDKKGRLGLRSISSKQYHQIVNEYQPSVYGQTPEDFDCEQFKGFEQPDSD